MRSYTFVGPETAYAVNNLETQILTDRIANDTLGGLEQHTHTFKEYGLDIVREIEDKEVADFGSGAGYFAKTVALASIKSVVHSVNPRLRRPDAKRAEETMAREQLVYYHKATPEQLENVQRYHDQHLVTDFAHNLSMDTGSVDVGVDIIAVHQYLPDDAGLYELTLTEMLRVMRPGGKIVVKAYPSSPEVGPRGLGVQGSVKTQVADTLGVRYDVKRNSSGICGAIIYA